MSNKLWIHEIEDDQCWTLLDNVCFSDGKNIHNVAWFDDIFDILKHPAEVTDTFYLVVRTNRNYNMVFSFLRSLFLKVMEIKVEEISSEDVEFHGAGYKDLELRVYVVEYKIINLELWNTKNLAKLVYYTYILSSLIDYPFSKGVINGTSLGSAVYNIFQQNDFVEEEKFFHSGLASLLNSLISLRQTSKKESHFVFDGPRFINNDIEGIEFVLQSREDLDEALTRVDDFDSTKITDEILIQYDTMRRNF